MSAAAEPRRWKRAVARLAPGLLVAVVLAAMAGLAARGSSRLAAGPYGQPLAQAATGELAAGSRAGQTFRADQSGLERIEIYLGKPKNQTHGPLVLHVTAAPFTGPDLAQATVDAAQLKADGWVAFAFPPLAAPAGQSLAFWLAAPEARPGYAVTVLGATQEAYAAGAAVFDGRPATHGVRDLAFRLYYQTGTWEGLAVLLARQADGRPGVFGWPPLYLALLLAYVLGVAMLLGVVINRLRL